MPKTLIVPVDGRRPPNAQCVSLSSSSIALIGATWS